MNFELFVARKIKSGGITGKKLSGPVIKVATLGVILGMVVMILSLSIGLGFKREVRQKIIGFGSHLQVMSYDYNNSYESNPITNDSDLVSELKTIDGVNQVQVFATKPGIIKTSEAIQGIILKGVGADFDWEFMEEVCVDGQIPNFKDSVRSNEIYISEEIANMLRLKVNDPLRMYFVQDQVRMRRFTVSGIYNSHFPEFDKTFAFVDIRHVQKLNNWDDTKVSGYEIIIDDFKQLDQIHQEVYYVTSSKVEENGTMLRAKTIRQVQPQIFTWLDMLDMNLLVILVLILLVAGFNMVSGLLILIIERTNMIGIFKALGAENWSLRKVFLYLALYIVGKGLIWGNLIGVGLALLQKYTQLIKLDAANYYLETVPVYLQASHLIMLNVGVAIITLLMLLGPSYLVARILPVKAIRFN
ncbi:ABC transporter permease [Carboxylicivirga linearis]|uniref:ABC transporter permease n=1 Tax=Carboxylicivirga linearis TaxID=1628157 RepID=A0ABS5JUB1_9BACT|nr:FtsX-like permease family protein [Carboxylicivirga linearis]MBS2097946.1 ABC transporter permease [Carboxylicivirga linearis]